MTTIQGSFSIKERIKSKKEISRIFSNGIFFYSKHLSLGFVNSLDKNQKCHKIAISVPKKLFKKAVSRNKLKRLIKESYRINKNCLYSSKNQTDLFFNLIFIYKAREFASFSDIQKEIIELLIKMNV